MKAELTSGNPVRITTGVELPSSRSCFRTTWPAIFGSRSSSTMTSNDRLRATASPASPSAAVSTLNPSSSRSRLVDSTTARSSSINRTRERLGWAAAGSVAGRNCWGPIGNGGRVGRPRGPNTAASVGGLTDTTDFFFFTPTPSGGELADSGYIYERPGAENRTPGAPGRPLREVPGAIADERCARNRWREYLTVSGERRVTALEPATALRRAISAPARAASDSSSVDKMAVTKCPG